MSQREEDRKRKLITAEIPADIVPQFSAHLKARGESVYSYLLGALQMRLHSEGDIWLAEKIRNRRTTLGENRVKQRHVRPLPEMRPGFEKYRGK